MVERLKNTKKSSMHHVTCRQFCATG